MYMYIARNQFTYIRSLHSLLCMCWILLQYSYVQIEITPIICCCEKVGRHVLLIQLPVLQHGLFVTCHMSYHAAPVCASVIIRRLYRSGGSKVVHSMSNLGFKKRGSQKE